MNKITRNTQVLDILNSLYRVALDKQIIIADEEYIVSLKTLFTTDTWGYREILLVVLVGMKLDKNYKPSIALYDCNPRAIYEEPIKQFLLNNGIPHRKSGPLNIAKATPGLNSNWAKQRKHPSIATEVVNLVKYMESNDTVIDNIGISLLRLLTLEANIVRNLKVNIPFNVDPEILYTLCCELINRAADGGNTPQKVVALLLKNYHAFLKTPIIVRGEQDRACVTSTTAKKPGDISEESIEGTVYKVYEVTIKLFGLERIKDSYDNIFRYNQMYNTNINEIIVICRKQDCPNEIKNSGLSFYLGSYNYQNIKYYYIDIYEWICYILHHMTPGSRELFYDELNIYISDINTAYKVKCIWKELHQ
ncbi:MAG: hypothetical protein ATN34_01780 [Epulopiscium sp. Nele67-Bin002]|nr:MAG: hypothetical protein ATN33_03395 [Epulopiscium sp. Nele67-Bin001]OON92653.1 MAG: hypothetical protein ATN34_01780 [Epulopiscium sp. Nele67-Bin002]